MSKSMGKILFLLTMFVSVQLYALLIYEYGEAYEFDKQINPMTIIFGSMVAIGVFGLIGQYLNNKDTKRGYCESGISQEQIDTYRSNHLFNQRESKCDATQTSHDHKSGDQSHENNDDQIR